MHASGTLVRVRITVSGGARDEESTKGQESGRAGGSGPGNNQAQAGPDVV